MERSVQEKETPTAKPPGEESAVRRLKHLQAFLLIPFYDEQLVETGNFENLSNIGVDVAQDELAASPLHFLVERDQLSQHRT